MKKKHIALASISVCALIIALLSLLIWIGGDIFVEKNEVLPSIHAELLNSGIYAQFNVDPEVGILPGDILLISWKIFFDPKTVEVDKNKIAEQYLEFKDNYLVSCEEYNLVKLKERTLRNARVITITAVFQCWFTQEQEITLQAMFQYSQVGKDSLASTSTLHLNKNIAFASIPIDKPRPLAEHTFPGHGLDIWLIALGAMFIICGAALPIKIAVSENKKRIAHDHDEISSGDDPLKTIAALRNMPTNIAFDKLYHLCLKIEKEEGTQDSLNLLKSKLREMYGINEVEREDFENCLDSLENILKNGGEAK